MNIGDQQRRNDTIKALNKARECLELEGLYLEEEAEIIRTSIAKTGVVHALNTLTEGVQQGGNNACLVGNLH